VTRVRDDTVVVLRDKSGKITYAAAGFLASPTGTDVNTMDINSELVTEAQKRQAETAKTVKAFERNAVIGQFSNVIAKFLVTQEWFRDWVTGNFWIKNNKWARNVLLAIDPEQWKTSLCNPQSGVGLGGSLRPGGEGPTADHAVSCSGVFCRTVLTQAVERVPYNYTGNTSDTVDQYLYTVVYTIGPVPESVYYNIQMTGEETRTRWPSPVLHPAGVQYTGKFSFLSPKRYDRMCFQFQEDFPAGDLSAQKEYCRDVKENAFNTGDPVRNAAYTLHLAQTSPTNYQSQSFFN
jgi:hypothetical protein